MLQKFVLFLLMATHVLTSVALESYGNELRKGLTAHEQLVSDPSLVTIELLYDAKGAMGYVRGVSDSLAITLPNCQPTNATYAQKMAIVNKYMKDHPEKWNQPTVLVVVTALKEAFKCGVSVEQK